MKRLLRARLGFTLLELMIVITLLGILIAILVPNFIRARTKSNFVACQSNLKNIATALEIYSSENQGHYPPAFNNLVPLFLKSPPVCPAISAPTYIGSYNVGTLPDIFTIYCQSSAHTPLLISPNYPQWCSISGLIDK